PGRARRHDACTSESRFPARRPSNLERNRIMATVPQTNTQPGAVVESLAPAQPLPELKLYSHSMLIYWWPVWLVGYLFALLTYLQGEVVTVGGRQMLIHPSKNLGVFYTVVFT